MSSVADLLLRAARIYPRQPALALGAHVVADYATLERRVAALALTLRRRVGLNAGERVALFMANCPQYVEVLFACWHGGLAAVPVNAKLHPRELEFILADSGARLCFVTPEYKEQTRDQQSPPHCSTPDQRAIAHIRFG